MVSALYALASCAGAEGGGDRMQRVDIQPAREMVVHGPDHETAPHLPVVRRAGALQGQHDGVHVLVL